MSRVPSHHGWIAILAILLAIAAVVWRLEQNPWPALASSIRGAETTETTQTLVVLSDSRWATELRHFNGTPALATGRLRARDLAGAKRVWIVGEGEVPRALSAELRQRFEPSGEAIKVAALRAELWEIPREGAQ